MTSHLINPSQIRRKLGLTQQDFWERIGVTQSAGSRYECGRHIPKSVQELLRVVHIERIDLSRINRDDLTVLNYLKTRHPDAFECFRKESVVHSDKMTAFIRRKRWMSP